MTVTPDGLAGKPVTRSIEPSPEEPAEHLIWQEHGQAAFLEIGGRWYLAFEVFNFDPDDR